MVNYRALLKDNLRDESLTKIKQLGLAVFEEDGDRYVEFSQPSKFLPTQYAECYLEQYIELTMMIPQVRDDHLYQVTLFKSKLEKLFTGFPILAQIAKLRKWLRKRNF